MARKMRKSYLFLFIVYFGLVGFAAAWAGTNYVDLAALAACRTGTTNGWEVSSITNYASAKAAYKPNIHYPNAQSYAKSPVFSSPIRRVEFDYRSSNTIGKRLMVASSTGESLYTCDYFANDTVFTNCVIEIDRPDVFSLIFKCDKGGESTTWSLANLKIITGLQPPSNLTFTTNGALTRLSWKNDALTISNRVDVYWRKEVSKGSTNEVLRYDLSKLGTVTSNRESNSLVYKTFNAALDGEKLFLLKDKPGVLRLSDGDKRGYLSIKCPENKEYTHLRLVLSRESQEDRAETTLSWGLPEQTNIVATIELTDTFITNFVSLSECSAAETLFLNATGYITDHRVLVEDIAFVNMRQTQYEHRLMWTTNAANAAFVDIRGLKSRCSHIFTVTAYTADGTSIQSATSAAFYPPCPVGMLFYLH